MADIEKLIDVFMHMGDHIRNLDEYGLCYDSTLAEAIEDVVEMLKNEKIRENPRKSEWIPVTERIPDWKDGKVLVFTKYGFSICERTVNGRWQGQHANWITHWMPLPEPPKEGE